MFSNCSSLNQLNLSSFNTSKVTDMSYMFNKCISLKELNLLSFNAYKVTDMSYMFNNCYFLLQLKCLDRRIIRKFNNQTNFNII